MSAIKARHFVAVGLGINIGAETHSSSSRCGARGQLGGDKFWRRHIWA